MNELYRTLASIWSTLVVLKFYMALDAERDFIKCTLTNFKMYSGRVQDFLLSSQTFKANLTLL